LVQKNFTVPLRRLSVDHISFKGTDVSRLLKKSQEEKSLGRNMLKHDREKPRPGSLQRAEKHYQKVLLFQNVSVTREDQIRYFE